MFVPSVRHLIGSLCAAAALHSAAVAAPPSPAARELQQQLTGALVFVKLDMPATSRGLDVWPDHAAPIDEKQYLDRIKDGIALHAGETTWVSDVRVTPRSIDVLFGGGGYNYLMDAGAIAAAGHGVKQKTQEQLQLETEIMKSASGNGQGMEALPQRVHERNELERDRLTGDRADIPKSAQEAAGSRLCIRFAGKVPAEKLTVAFVLQSLAEYVEFVRAPAAAP